LTNIGGGRVISELIGTKQTKNEPDMKVIHGAT